jgi:hypothetical protein
MRPRRLACIPSLTSCGNRDGAQAEDISGLIAVSAANSRLQRHNNTKDVRGRASPGQGRAPATTSLLRVGRGTHLDIARSDISIHHTDPLH